MTKRGEVQGAGKDACVKVKIYNTKCKKSDGEDGQGKGATRQSELDLRNLRRSMAEAEISNESGKFLKR